MYSIIVEYDSRDKPLTVWTHNTDTDKSDQIICYAPKSGMTLEEVDNNLLYIRDIFLGSIDGKHSIVTHNFKTAIRAFNLPLVDNEYDVYDVTSKQLDHSMVKPLAGIELLSWQRLMANASTVYHEMELNGLLHNELARTPQWRPDLVTGRARCTGFNIQGLSKNDDMISVIRTKNTSENDLLYHFDWVAADIMVAAYMSQDEVMLEAFRQSDPYTYLATCLDKSRDECKKLLLVSINSLDLGSEVFTVYKRLKQWIMEQMQHLQQDGRLSTFMGRTFRTMNSGEWHKIFNYTLQGGTAHLMQGVLCRMRRVPNVTLVADLHDGLVLICPPSAEVVMLKEAQAILATPLNLYGVDICMPFRVSKCKVGDGWHKWAPVLVCRDGIKWMRAS